MLENWRADYRVGPPHLHGRSQKTFREELWRSRGIRTPAAWRAGRIGAEAIPAWQRARTAIGVIYHLREENVAFLEFSRHFRRHGLPVPEIYGDDLKHGAYLEEDLGDLTLYELLSKNRSGGTIAPEVMTAYRKVVTTLPRFQVEAGRDLNYKVCYPRARFDRQSIAWDLNYFKYYFLRLSGTPFNEQRLENDFRRLTAFLLKAKSDYFLYRDFQSRNIMLRDGEPFFLDYQGGRHGALQYDIASLLFDSKADLPPDVRQQLLEHYLDELSKFVELDRDDFLRYYYGFVYIRVMQALGAYGFRGLYERKTHFLRSVPFALANVRWLLNNVELPIKLPALMKAFEAMLNLDTLQAVTEPERLTVRISSFSFHRGVPQDNSGHGGGFVFDARGLPNPGREERFKALTGKDARGDRVPRTLSERARVLVACRGASGWQRQQLSATRLQTSQRRLRMHRRPASLGVPGGVAGEASAFTEWNRCDPAAPRAGEAILMRAMILAAGLGTRLRPLTDECPKALVEINGRSLLEIALTRLRSFGINDVILNVHHFADKVIDYLQANQSFGMNIAVSREEILLDTGGGLKKAAWFFLQDNDDEPFVVHNVDVLSSIDLERMVEAHFARKALVTLAVQGRDTSRHLLFDENLQLCKREVEPKRDGAANSSAFSQLLPLGFCGIHVISPRIFLADAGRRRVLDYPHISSAGRARRADPGISSG